MPSRAQGIAEGLSERRRFAGQEMLGHVDDHDLAAEPPHDLGHLYSDRATAEDKEATGDGLHGGGFAAAPDPVEFAEPRNRRDDRVGAVGEHDVVGGVADPVDLDRARTCQAAAAAQQVIWLSASQRSCPASE